MKMPSKKYKRNYLSDVIFKIDFPVILELTENPPRQFQNKIINDFPILEPIKQIDIEIKRQETTQVLSTLWKFKNEDNSNLIELKINSLAVIQKKYTDYQDFKKLINIANKAIFDIYPITKINRLGLRYINQINLEEPKFFEWEDYINNSLLGGLKFIKIKNKIRRIMQSIRITPEEDIILNLVSGIFNSTYPGKIVKKEFILDYDCFTKIQFDKETLEKKVDKFHKIIVKYFKKSITDKFRKKLNNE